MVLIVAIALAGSLFATMQVLSIRADELADDRLTHAADDFRAFTESPVADQHETVDALITRYLRDTIPNRAETAFSVVDGEPSRRPPGEPPARLDADPVFVPAVAGVSEPTAGTLDTDAGPAPCAAIPASMAGGSRRGAPV